MLLRYRHAIRELAARLTIDRDRCAQSVVQRCRPLRGKLVRGDRQAGALSDLSAHARECQRLVDRSCSRLRHRGEFISSDSETVEPGAIAADQFGEHSNVVCEQLDQACRVGRLALRSCEGH